MIRESVVAFMSLSLVISCFSNLAFSAAKTPRAARKAVEGGDASTEAEQVREYYPNGKLKNEIPYVNGKIQGIKKSYFEDGSLHREEEYREGKREGVSREYFGNGALKEYETFKDDRVNGECYTNYPTGQRMKSGQCIDGKKSGKWTFFHINGNRYMEGNYIDDMMEGEWHSFAPEGWLDSSGEYRKGSQSGIWVYYDRNRKIIRKLTLKESMIDGMCWMYKDGKLMSEGIMTGHTHEPVKNGIWKSYYDNGLQKVEGVYAGGKKNGQFKEYYPTGIVKSVGEFVNGKRHGNWIFYQKDGKTIIMDKSGRYTAGKLNKKFEQ